MRGEPGAAGDKVVVEYFVGLTMEGKRLRRRLAAAHTRDIERSVGAALSPAEHRQLHTILGKLLADSTPADRS